VSFRTAGPNAQRLLAVEVPAVPAAGCDEREARLRGTGTRPIRGGHLGPEIHTDYLSVDFQGLA
jgi:hypothetical protein